MSGDILILDLETKRTFEDVGGSRNMGALGVSLVGVYSYSTKQYYDFWEADFEKLDAWLAERPLVVGFNQRKFDMPVLQPHVKTDLASLPMLDVMEELHKILGHRIGLDSVAQATLGISKSGHGLDAITYWNNKKFDKLKKYCLDDVRITKEIYEYGAKHGELFYTSKYGKGRMQVDVGWGLAHPEENQSREEQISLF